MGEGRSKGAKLSEPAETERSRALFRFPNSASRISRACGIPRPRDLNPLTPNPLPPFEFPRDSGDSNRRGTSIENGRGQVRGGQAQRVRSVVGPNLPL
jgi:hypothetical protein